MFCRFVELYKFFNYGLALFEQWLNDSKYPNSQYLQISWNKYRQQAKIYRKYKKPLNKI